MKSSAVLRIGVFVILLAIATFAENDGSQLDEETVRFAAFIHRHGDRSPVHMYPNDPHNNYKWPGGRGALSPLGSLQMYTLGTTLRRRYHRLLPSDGFYTDESMEIFSSPRKRTLMSSQSFLAGFMPPPIDRNPLPILWQPVAIHSMPRDLDNLIMQGSPCQRYDQAFSELMSNPSGELRRFYEENAEWIAYLSEHTGRNGTNVQQGLALWDILSIERNNNLTLPAWTDAVFPDRLTLMAERGLAVPLHTPYMRLVKGSPLVKRIYGQMLDKKNGEAPNRSVYVYSGHDSTILSVIKLLNLTNQTTGIPDYGATLAFELHCIEDGDCSQPEVRILYYFRFTDSSPKQLTIPNCPAPCTLDRFAESISEILSYDYANGCKLDEENSILPQRE